MAELVSLHRGQLDSSKEYSGLTFAEQFDAELPAPAGQALLGLQSWLLRVDLQVCHCIGFLLFLVANY
jgi:hypothetical protein